MDIYEPAEDSYLLQKFVKKYAYGRVLDVGTGSGIQSLTALKNSKVKKVVAIDINKDAVNELNKKIKEKNLLNITAFKSDLFDKVNGKFDVIIFNPPYLPQDKGIIDLSIYGGKKGWELSQKFFHNVSKYLSSHGSILFLFSSLTNQHKINKIISNNLLQFEEIGTQKISFEQLYVYKIVKSRLLQTLEKRKISSINYFAQGKRGVIYQGILNGKTVVAIKIKRENSAAERRILNEIKFLKKLNTKFIGPKLLLYGKSGKNDYLVCQFITGYFILDWIKKNNSNKIKRVITKVLEQCYVMDTMCINKREMHHPLKHIIIDKYDNPFLIDFERSRMVKKLHNVTQFIEFICRIQCNLKGKGIKIDVKAFREAAQKYKQGNANSWKTIKETIKNS